MSAAKSPATANKTPTPQPTPKDHSWAIRVRGLGKCYRTYDRPYDRLRQAMPWNRTHWFREFWALRDVSFQVSHGSTIGVLGRNGSGKSTLLQMLCGTLTPTQGTIESEGRTAALLELGAGFNPDFTGRENVYLNAAILGLSRKEIDERYDAIARFSELGSFLERPVRTYSSGMFVRLAFAVATTVDPDILIVDEALAVGDEAFQRKCHARIDAIKRGGGTIFFVSHSASAVVELCDHALLLDAGELLLQGTPKTVAAQYQKLLYAPADKLEMLRQNLRDGKLDLTSAKPATPKAPPVAARPPAIAVAPAAAPPVATTDQPFFDPHLLPTSTVTYEGRGAAISNWRITTLAGEPVNHLVGRQEYLFHYRIEFSARVFRVRCGMLMKTLAGVELGGAQWPADQSPIDMVERGDAWDACFRFQCLLQPGTYFLNAGVMGVVDGADVFLARLVDVSMFRVLPRSNRHATGTIDFMIDPDVSVMTVSDTVRRAS